MTDPAALEALARRIAEEAHAGQVDKAGEPYIGHVQRVAARLDDPLDRAVAWLHDVVEDTDTTLLDLARLGRRDGAVGMTEWSRVVGDVAVLTHGPNEPRAAYYDRISSSPRAVRVKLADIADNSDEERLAKLPEKDQVRLKEKYRKAREALSGTLTP